MGLWPARIVAHAASLVAPAGLNAF
jgi:hypothetical protein